MTKLTRLPNFEFSPKYNSDVENWHPHQAFAYDLVGELRPKVVVELGVHLGDSYFTFCQARREHGLDSICYAVDTWEGDEQAGSYGEEVYSIVKAYNEKYYADFSYLIRSTFNESKSQFDNNSIDLLHIDGLHTYEAVKEDFENWLPKVKKGGIILIHDVVAKNSGFGTWKFWEKLQGQFPSFTFQSGWGLGVLQNSPQDSSIHIGRLLLSENFKSKIQHDYLVAHKLTTLKKELDSSHIETNQLRQLLSVKKQELQAWQERASVAESSNAAWEERALLAEGATQVWEQKATRLEKLKKSWEQKAALAEKAIEDEKIKLIDSDLRASVLQKHLDDSGTRITIFENKIKSLINKSEISQDKIIRMTKSFSWKITSPIRFLRRKFLDSFQSTVSEEFNPRLYLELNPDLKEIFDDDWQGATNHFLIHGKDEGRPFSYQHAPPPHLRTFEEWIRRYEENPEFNPPLSNFKIQKKPLFSIILPVFDPPIPFLEAALNSVVEQNYDNWELCIVDDASQNEIVRDKLKEFASREPRIKLHLRKINGHISAASNTAIDLASGEFLVFFDHDDLLCPQSLSRLAETLNDKPQVKFIYSDEDKINAKGKRSDPYFKPDWNPELLLSQNYICHLTCCELKLVKEAGNFRKGYEGAQDWDLFLRVTEKLKEFEIFHIPEILYHWRSTSSSTAKSVQSKNYVLESAKKTLLDAIERRNIDGSVIPVSEKFSYWRIERKLPEKKPLVSILIPTKDKLRLLRSCIDSLKNKTDYSNYEIIILDNDSTDPETQRYFVEFQKHEKCNVLQVPGPFNYSKINNKGARNAEGEILLLLNNDIEIIQSNWLTEIVSHAIRPEIGCVGAKLLYSDDTIQHAGVILGLGGVAGHAYRGFSKNHTGSRLRLHLSQNFEAVTGACLAIRKDVFEEVNGLDEENLTVAFNDVDFCIRVGQAGYRNLWTPFATLYHHESASRGSDETPKNKKRFQKEVDYMKAKWKDLLMKDSTYNPNLTLLHEDFSLAFPPRTKTFKTSRNWK